MPPLSQDATFAAVAEILGAFAELGTPFEAIDRGDAGSGKAMRDLEIWTLEHEVASHCIIMCGENNGGLTIAMRRLGIPAQECAVMEPYRFLLGVWNDVEWVCSSATHVALLLVPWKFKDQSRLGVTTFSVFSSCAD